MKILHTVQSYDPSVGGMQEVVKQLSTRLAKKGHEVTIATSYHSQRFPQNPQASRTLADVRIEEFNLGGNSVDGYRGSEDEQKRYQQYLQETDADIVVNFAAQQWATDLALPILEKIKAKKVFVPTGFSRLHDPLYVDYFKNLPDRMKLYDENIFLSETYQDINFAKTHGISKIKVIPNAAAKDEFSATSEIDIRKNLAIPAHDFLILLVGSHTGQKGHAEAIEIFSKSKIKNATLLIVANSFGRGCTYSCAIKNTLKKFSPSYKNNSKQLIIKSLNRKETLAAYIEADLFLFPSNVECSPLVLFEAMASRTPFLSTDAGNAAEIISWSQGGILLPTEKSNTCSSGYVKAKISESITLLESVYNNPTLLEKMGAAGFAAWQEKFTWEKITDLYETTYKNILLI